MSRKITITIVFLIISGAIIFNNNFQSAAADTSQPNIILMVADDLGYADISPYNPQITHTPNLARLAETGVWLTDFYVTASVCTPTRAALLTGRHQIRTLMVTVNYFEWRGLLPWEMTLAEELQEEGYATAMVGKWHLGTGQRLQYFPTRQGFDYFYGVPFSNNYHNLVIYRDEKIVVNEPVQETLTQQFTEEALDFIAEKANEEEPFFLYLPYTAPHMPLFVRDEFAHPETHSLYEDVVQELDWSVGEILNQLEAYNIRQNTIVVFISDNGPELEPHYSEALHERWGREDAYGRSRWFREEMGTLRGSKATVFEGGVRVPFIASWPEGLGEENTVGQAIHTPAVVTDLFPTLVAVAGGETDHPPLDGQDILPILRGQQLDEPRAFYFGTNNDWTVRAMRFGDWKIHWDGDTTLDPIGLYDLSSETGLVEQKNLLDTNPEIARQLTVQAQQFQEDVEVRPLLQRLDSKLSSYALPTNLVLILGSSIFLVTLLAALIFIRKRFLQSRTH